MCTVICSSLGHASTSTCSRSRGPTHDADCDDVGDDVGGDDDDGDNDDMTVMT